ncbi:hypothetical protein ACQ4PT_059392 [Festuca glaucescens]
MDSWRCCRHGAALPRNTRGLVEMGMLNIRRDKEGLDDDSFVVMVSVPSPLFLKWSETPITFSREDQWTSFSEPGRYPLVLDPVTKTMDPFEFHRDLEQEDLVEDIIRDVLEADGEDRGSGDGEDRGSGDGEAECSGDGECGVLVRDRIPITIREWNKTKNVSESEVADRYKDMLFDDLMAHFTLPDLGSESEMDKQKALVKKWALKKMGELFRAWKNRLWATYKADKKPPLFEGYLAKQEHN